MHPSRSLLVMLAFAACAVCVLLLTWTRLHRVEPSPGMPSGEVAPSTGTVEPLSTAMSAGVSRERTQPATATEESVITERPEDRSVRIDPRRLRGNDSTFKSAPELEHDPAVNPRHVVLTSEQRKQLQALLSEAEQAVSSAASELQLAVNGHARTMIDQGLGWDVPPGQQARKSDPRHDSLFSTFTPDKGTRAYSFDAQRDPETASHWQHKDAVIDDYSKRILTFFGSL